MKEKTYQYEEKKKQLHLAKERLNAAKARFKKRLNKAKEKNRNRAYSDKRRYKRNHAAHTVSDPVNKSIATASTKPSTKFHTINENSDADTDNKGFTVSLSRANLSKFNHNQPPSSLSSSSVPMDASLNNKFIINTAVSHHGPSSATSTPIFLGLNSRQNNYANIIAATTNGTPTTHNRGGTNSSIFSAISAISDQSFIEDFHSIT
eukprot:148862_1